MYDGLYKPCYLTGKTQHQQKNKKTFLERTAWGCCGARTLSHSSWLPFTLQLRWLAISRGWTLRAVLLCGPWVESKQLWWCCNKAVPSPDQRDALHSFVRLSAIGPKHKHVYLHKADPSLASPSAAVLGVRTRWTGSLQQLRQQLQHRAIYIFLLNKVRWICLKLFIPEPNAKMIFGNKSTSIFISTAAKSVRSQAGLHWAARWFILLRGRCVRVILHRGGCIIV